MLSPEQETEQQIENLLAGQSITNDSGIMQDIVDHYRSEKLPPHLKRRILQKAEHMTEKPKRSVKQSPWIGRLVAGLILTLGLFGAYSFGTYNETLLASPVEVAATEIVLDTVEPLFSDTPEILPDFGFEYGGFTTIGNIVSGGDLMQDAGMQWVGIHIYFGEDWGTSDLEEVIGQIHIAHQNGFKILVSVSVLPIEESVASDDFLQRYTQYLAELAITGADAIEIMREANIIQIVPERFFGTESYADILRQSAEAIREANPDTLIISGAPAPTGAENAFEEQVINDDNFLQQLMDRDALAVVDCVGMQYDEGAVPPLVTEGDVRDDYYTRYLPVMLQRYRQVVDAEIPICITSLGYFSAEEVEPIPDAFAWTSGTSRAEQEQWISDAIAWLSYQSDVQLVMVWHIDHTYSFMAEGTNLPVLDAYSLLHPRD